MRTVKYFWRQPKATHDDDDHSDPESFIPQVAVVRGSVSRYGNQDLYSTPDNASCSTDMETQESLDAKDYDNKIPIKLTPRQIESLVDFIKDQPVFYDKKETGWININERLSVATMDKTARIEW